MNPRNDTYRSPTLQTPVEGLPPEPFEPEPLPREHAQPAEPRANHGLHMVATLLLLASLGALIFFGVVRP